MEILLARHGNTFSPGQKVVWVGSQNDLALVESGINQGRLLGKTLLSANTKLDAVYTGPLQRMTSYAQIILNEMNPTLSAKIDLRLNEIDYGKWSGLTTDEVCQRFGTKEFENWEKHSIWPQFGEWSESAELVAKRIREFTNELMMTHKNNETILVVASNGCLRYFLDLIPGQLQKQIENHTAKIATGNLCKLIFQKSQWKVGFWNKSPQELFHL